MMTFKSRFSLIGQCPSLVCARTINTVMGNLQSEIMNSLRQMLEWVSKSRSVERRKTPGLLVLGV